MEVDKILIITGLRASWWIDAIVLGVLALAGYIFHRNRLNTVKHEKADLERQLLEQSELLSYARLNEQRYREEAVLADQNKSHLISKISHDIRTPMTTMLGMASLLNETKLSAEQRDYTNNIIESGEGLVTLINDILMSDILEYSKVESGKELELKDVDLHTCIEGVLEIFALKTASSMFDLIYHVDSDVPAYIVADGERLRQILMNLIENSIKFTVAGEIFIGVHFKEERSNKVLLEFEVRDTGTGISRVKLNQLVKELQHPGISFNTHSTAGVGLLISKKLVELMGGSISIDSQEDAGTTVKFSVLVRKSPKKPRRLFNLDLPTLKGKKVLIVDDNKTFRNFLKQQLQPWKLDVTTAGSGEEALQQIGESGDFDMAIIDMQMPGMDGVQLAQNIRKSHPALPLMLTNKTGNEAYKKDHSLFNAIVSKPVKQHVFNEQVLGLLRNSDVVETDKPTLSVDFAKKYPLRIILAEDNVMNQKLVTKILNKLGYEPYITSNGKEVLEEVSHNVYDLILMDVQMDEMDGLEATRMIRLCLSVQPIIIAMTANTMQGDREECLQAGMDDYLGKPVKLEELVKIIEKWAIHSRQYNN